MTYTLPIYSSKKKYLSQLKKNKQRVLVIGLDCADPNLIFNHWRKKLPTLNNLMSQGIWGSLTSTIPAITVPAWNSMLSSLDPGQLGLYGFHNRYNYSYQFLKLATASSTNQPTIIDYLTLTELRSILVGVPLSYPPQPIKGIQTSCFLTPNIKKIFTWPPILSQKIRKTIGEYIPDIPEYRSKNKNQILNDLYLMTSQHLALVSHLLVKEKWDFFMFVEIGTDRANHSLWRFQDSNHPYYQPTHYLANSLLNYYLYLDTELNQLLKQIKDDVVIWIVSDHGAQSIQGGFHLNQWLLQHGYLALKKIPNIITPLNQCQIDWSRTTAWAAGGYYGRIYINLKGREPHGIVEPRDYEKIRNEIIINLKELNYSQSKNSKNTIKNQIFKPQKIYQQCRGFPPDLLVYLGSLAWRVLDGLSKDTNLYSFINDTGIDYANHSQKGIFIYYNPQNSNSGQYNNSLSIYDLAPAFLYNLGLIQPKSMLGKLPPFLINNNKNKLIF